MRLHKVCNSVMTGMLVGILACSSVSSAVASEMDPAVAGEGGRTPVALPADVVDPAATAGPAAGPSADPTASADPAPTMPTMPAVEPPAASDVSTTDPAVHQTLPAAPTELPAAASAQFSLPAIAAAPVAATSVATTLQISAINSYWSTRQSLLGHPVGPAIAGLLSGAVLQQFQHGSVYLVPGRGTYAVRGGIGTFWAARGSETGGLRLPASDERAIARSGAAQAFDGGSVYWSPVGGPQIVLGAVGARWAGLGAQDGVLGYPTTSERATGGGTVQSFEGGPIYWSTRTGAHPVRGGVLAWWSARGWEGTYGFPTGSERGLTRGGALQNFERVTVYWSPMFGPKGVGGEILTEYGHQGWEQGGLGYPTSESWRTGTVWQQEFERGTIVFDTVTGRSSTLLKVGTTPSFTNGIYRFNMSWVGQQTNYWCGPATAEMILRRLGGDRSADGVTLSQAALATSSYMNTDAMGRTAWIHSAFPKGMNRWLGQSAYTQVGAPSGIGFRAEVLRSFSIGRPMAVDTQEYAGMPHYNMHPNRTYSHIMAVEGYDTRTGEVLVLDPAAGVLFPQSQRLFAHDAVSFGNTYLQSFGMFHG